MRAPLARAYRPLLGSTQLQWPLLARTLIMSAAADTPPPSRTAARPATPLLEPTPLATRTMAYLDGSPDPFHATENACARLREAGFTEISERDSWGAGGAAAHSSPTLRAGGKYFFTRNRSCVVAFAVGGKYESSRSGFKVIGAHTDSPNLKVKPRSLRSASGCLQLAVECYGGGLWHTWFDRDLSVSGRVLIRQVGPDGVSSVVQRLVRFSRPLLRVPKLCIHLQSGEEREAFKVNKEEHMQPILALEVEKALNGGGEQPADAREASDVDASDKSPSDKSTGEWVDAQQPALLSLIAHELNVHVADIADFELNLYDVQPAALSGAQNEFLCSARLDNLASCALAVEAITEHTATGLDEEKVILFSPTHPFLPYVAPYFSHISPFILVFQGRLPHCAL